MLTKQELEAEAFANVDKYPMLAAAYRAGDPTVTQHIGAMAAMLAMALQQLETAAMERFSKERDSTILADAAIRGIVPRAKSARIRVLSKNKGAVPVSLELGRVLLDDSGNAYRVETPVTVGSGLQAPIVLSQISIKAIRHTVQESLPFYAVEIPPPDDGSYLSSIAVVGAAGEYTWAHSYTNVAPGDAAYHVEVDDQRRVYVRFGMQDIVGVQPAVGEVITLSIGYAMGDVVPAAQSKLALDYTNAAEANLEFTFDALVQRGENPMGMDVLREMAKYPSVYADDAVFLGEFDALVRKNFQNLQFCSVWNEAAEELVRGANLDNQNRLFVAVVGPDGQEPVLVHDGGAEPPVPVRIAESELTELQKEIRRKIMRADDSLRVTFCTPVISEIPLQVDARVASSFPRDDVSAQISKQVLATYGKSSAAARRGYNRPLYQQTYALLRKQIPALSGGDADFQLSIGSQTASARPELWRFVSETTLVVNVQSVNTVIPSWGA